MVHHSHTFRLELDTNWKLNRIDPSLVIRSVCLKSDPFAYNPIRLLKNPIRLLIPFTITHHHDHEDEDHVHHDSI